MTAWVIGLDLSLTAPAACALPLDWRPGDWRRARVSSLKPDAPSSKDDIEGQLVRYCTIRGWIHDLPKILDVGQPKAVYIEDYAFSKNMANGSRLRELGGVVKMEIWEKLKLVPVTVAANTARKTLFGRRKLPRSDVKVHVQRVIFDECKAPTAWTEDEADAYCCSNHALSVVGGKFLVLE